MVGKVSRKKRHAFEDGTSFEGGWERGLFHGHGTLTWGKLRGMHKLMSLTAGIVSTGGGITSETLVSGEACFLFRFQSELFLEI